MSVVEAEEPTDPQVWVDECDAQWGHFGLDGRMESNVEVRDYNKGSTLKLVSLRPHTRLKYIDPKHALQTFQRLHDLVPLRPVVCTRYRKYKHIRQLAGRLGVLEVVESWMGACEAGRVGEEW